MFKKWLIAAVILLVIGISGTLLTAKPYFSLQNENEKQTNRFQSSDIQSINISNSVGTIMLLETTGDEIIVETSGSKLAKAIKVEAKDDLLSITNKADKKISIGIDFKKSYDYITVYLPKKHYEKVTVSNEVGEITINQIDAAELKVESELGNIEISDVTSTRMNASSEVGAISIEQYSGKLEVENEMGSIVISTDAVTQSIIAKNEIGEITLTIDQEPKDIFISADSEIGSTQIFGNNTGSYKSGDGNITVQLRTETGSIQVHN